MVDDDKIDITFNDEKPKKKVTKKSSPKRAKKKKSNTGYYTIAIIILLVAGIYLIYTSYKQTPVTTEEEDGVVATVNGEPIYLNELEETYESLPGQMKLLFSKEALLDQLVTEKLLMQDVAANDITVSEEEVDASIQEIEATLPEGIALEDTLESQGMTMEDFRKDMKKQLLVTKLLDETVYTDIEEVSEDEKREFFEENAEENQTYEELEEAIVSILENNQKRELATQYLDELKEGADVETMLGPYIQAEALAACAADYDITEDTVVFYKGDCKYSNEMGVFVDSLDDFTFYHVSYGALDDFATTCMSEILGEEVPLLVCVKNGEMKKGNMMLDDLRAFAQSCQ